MNRTHRALSALILALALFAPASLAEDKREKKDPGRGINFYSIEREIALGKELAEEVEREARMVNDPVISEYVNRIGQNLVRHSDARVPFTIKVVDSSEVNAFALPGGFFFVNSGLVLMAANEAELAGVMAHEIAHVAARHATRQATRGTIVNYATIPMIFMGGWAGYAVRQAAGIAIPMGFLKFSRGFEAEADRLGLEYLDRTGYDPLAFVDFFERIQTLEKNKPGAIAKIFSSHPMTDSRIRKAQKEIQTVLRPHPEYVLDTSEFQSVKARLQALQDRREAANSSSEPALRRRGASTAGQGDEKEKEEDAERPKLKRR